MLAWFRKEMMSCSYPNYFLILSSMVSSFAFPIAFELFINL